MEMLESATIVTPTALDAVFVEFCTDRQFPLHALHWIPGEDVPQPYRSLLVHNSDMTPTLEYAHGQAIALNVLHRTKQRGCLLREILLHGMRDGRCVEYGLICINLAYFPQAAQEEILRGRQPLGDILRENLIDRSSRPVGFFSLLPTTPVKQALIHCGDDTLYGRRNCLFDSGDHLLADVIEVLPRITQGEENAR